MSFTTTLLYIVSFIYIYNVPFTHSPLSGSKLMIIFMLLWLALRGKKLIIRQKIFKPVAWMIILLLYSLLNVFLQGTGDMGLVYCEVLFILNHILGCVLLINLFQSMGKNSIEDVMHMMVMISFVQAIIIILSMLIPAFNNLIASIAFIEGRDNLQFRYGYARGYGLAASVTYDLSVCQAFTIMFMPYLSQKTQSKNRRIFYIVASIPILFSILTLGRTGLVGVGLAFIYTIRESTKLSSKIIINLLYIIAVLFIGVTFFLGNSESALVSSLNSYVFEGFDTLISTGRLSTHTGTNLMRYWSKTAIFSNKTWIIGDARYTEGIHYYMHVDIGIMRDILYFGLIGCAILAIIYIIIYNMIVKKKDNKQLMFLTKMLFIFLMVAQFKGEFLLACGSGICLVLMLAISSEYSNQDETISCSYACMRI